MREKRELDEVDVELIQLLAEDARRPFSELAERVGLSPPAVSDRIDRLREQGVIRQFTVNVDRRKLQNRTPVLVRLRTHPSDTDDLYREITALHGVEHAFKLYDGTIIAHGNAPGDNPREWLYSGVDMDRVTEFDVDLVEQYEWSMELDKAEFSVPCVVCGNTVTSDGMTVTVNGETVAFCCPSCKASYEQEH